MNSKFKAILSVAAGSLLVLSASSWAQDDADDDKDAAKEKEAKLPVIHNEATVGAYYLDQDSYRYGKYSGLKDKGWYALVDFRLEKRPEWDSGDTIRWRLQGWRLGLESRQQLRFLGQAGGVLIEHEIAGPQAPVEQQVIEAVQNLAVARCVGQSEVVADRRKPGSRIAEAHRCLNRGLDRR